jgi:1,4-dihydroxy-6-naphthoate synthase
MKLSIGFSPCPNDTFIFDALVNKKIDTGDLQFEPVLEDVQTLNQWAREAKLDVTKLSYAVLPLVLQHYQVLNSGSALGKGVGPLLISGSSQQEEIVEQNLIAIPGENTTAHLLFSLKYPHARNKIFLRYDLIEEFVLAGKGLGVIIHENRFTYAEKGLIKITDLGDYWEQQMQAPIPLGGIVISRKYDHGVQQRVDHLIRQSIEYAFHHYPELTDYIRMHSQEMSEAVMRKHIDLYVNEHSIALGAPGKEAVLKLTDMYCKLHDLQIDRSAVFV